MESVLYELSFCKNIYHFLTWNSHWIFLTTLFEIYIKWAVSLRMKNISIVRKLQNKFFQPGMEV